jgi:Lrp/AsnC family leucine-responsive transcriptional regulator
MDKTPGLDIKDKKILYELDLNSRVSLTQLSKKVQLSQPACFYRLNNLIKNGIIKFFLTNIDYGFFGYFPYRFFCRFQNLTEEKEKKLIEFLKNHDYVPFLASCTGKFDLMFCIMAKDISNLKKSLNEIKNKFGEHFSEQQIATIISGEFYSKEYLLGKNKRQVFTRKQFGEQPKKIKLDEKDIIILREISNNSRISAIELSEKVNLSLDAVRYRMKNLEKSHIINGYTIYFNNKNMGQLRYKIMIQLREGTEEKENKLLSFAQSIPEVVYSVKTFGAWDLELDIETNSAERFNHILREIKNRNSDMIKEYNVVQLIEVYKYNHLPMKPDEV